MNRRVGAFAVALAMALSVAGTLQASLQVLDSAGDSAVINGVFFWVPDPDVGNIPSGTGSFLRFQDSSAASDPDLLQSGFNTTHPGPLSPTPDDMVTSDELQTSWIPELSFGGTTYREFALSIQEPPGQGGFLDLIALELAPSTTPLVSDFTSLTSVTIIGGGSDTIRLSNIYGGTNVDMLMYVPTTSSAFDNDYVVMYNVMDNAGDGPDEWDVNTAGPLGTIPEPGSLIVWSLLGTLGLAAGWRRRTRKRA